MKSNRREFLKIAGAAIVVGAAGNVLTGGNAEAGDGLGAGTKATTGRDA